MCHNFEKILLRDSIVDGQLFCLARFLLHFQSVFKLFVFVYLSPCPVTDVIIALIVDFHLFCFVDFIDKSF